MSDDGKDHREPQQTHVGVGLLYRAIETSLYIRVRVLYVHQFRKSVRNTLLENSKEREVKLDVDHEAANEIVKPQVARLPERPVHERLHAMLDWMPFKAVRIELQKEVGEDTAELEQFRKEGRLRLARWRAFCLVLRLCAISGNAFVNWLPRAVVGIAKGWMGIK